MQENLVIVESPAKAKTIEKFLGKDFMVKSSFGHISDLAKKGISIDIENNFAPNYEISEDKKKLVAELKKLAKSAKTVWLASDEDREGEAIAWHLSTALNLKPENTKRIVFHEITKNAILHAVENPRDIDMNLVNAQQARRILDRLVGFEISPILWKKVKPSLSAGRVQSVAVRLIVDRERDIMNFKSTDYYRVTAEFILPEGKVIKAELDKRFSTVEEAEKFLTICSGADFKVTDVDKRPAKKSPAAPFTTSTLQQEASRKLGFSVSQTMTLAQKLYEAGLITYMRTDSVNLSGAAIGAAKEMIYSNFGEEYHQVRKFQTKSKGAQEAHEAIRPTYMDKTDVAGSAQEKRLYDLIWKRTVASQMADAQLEKTNVNIAVSGSNHRFVATGEVVKFDGFLKLYIESHDDENHETDTSLLPPITVGEALTAQSITATQRFTQRPARYSEASLVKQLEELGIGRPSTYSPTITTIINRGYVVKEDRAGTKRDFVQLVLKNSKITKKKVDETVGTEKAKLFPTDIGIVVTDYLYANFAEIMDYNFTANVEKEFDEIADGEMVWTKMLAQFYGPFHKLVDKAGADSNYTNNQRVIGTDPATGKTIYAKMGRYGAMVQLGEAEGDEKPRYAGLVQGQLIETLSIEQALSLLALPRTLGEYENKVVVIGIGRFGPYVRHDSKFVSLKKGVDDPYTITLERAIELIEDKRKVESNKLIKQFDNDPDMQILNGRYGAYIAYKSENYRIPKETDPATLTHEQCLEIVAKPKPKTSRYTRKAK